MPSVRPLPEGNGCSGRGATDVDRRGWVQRPFRGKTDGRGFRRLLHRRKHPLICLPSIDSDTPGKRNEHAARRCEHNAHRSGHETAAVDSNPTAAETKTSVADIPSRENVTKCRRGDTFSSAAFIPPQGRGHKSIGGAHASRGSGHEIDDCAHASPRERLVSQGRRVPSPGEAYPQPSISCALPGLPCPLPRLAYPLSRLLCALPCRACFFSREAFTQPRRTCLLPWGGMYPSAAGALPAQGGKAPFAAGVFPPWLAASAPRGGMDASKEGLCAASCAPSPAPGGAHR